jgi:hypothetical protein
LRFEELENNRAHIKKPLPFFAAWTKPIAARGRAICLRCSNKKTGRIPMARCSPQVNTIRNQTLAQLSG